MCYTSYFAPTLCSLFINSPSFELAELTYGTFVTQMYGERNLCDNEKIANLANDNDYIHIFVKVSDIRGAEANFCNIDVSRLHSRLESILPSPPKSPGVSALTQALSPGKSSGSLSVPSPDRR